MLIDSRLLTIRLRSEEDECRFYIYNEARHSVPGLYPFGKSEFYETCFTRRTRRRANTSFLQKLYMNR